MTIKPLTVDFYYLFRDGMTLRRKHVEELFNTDILHLAYPDLVEHINYSYRGTDELKRQLPPVEYNVAQFKMGAPDIYDLYKHAPDQPLSTTAINNLPYSANGDSQFTQGFLSGILKHDSRGYYFDKKGRQMIEVWELSQL